MLGDTLFLELRLDHKAHAACDALGGVQEPLGLKHGLGLDLAVDNGIDPLRHVLGSWRRPLNDFMVFKLCVDEGCHPFGKVVRKHAMGRLVLRNLPGYIIDLHLPL